MGEEGVLVASEWATLCGWAGWGAHRGGIYQGLATTEMLSKDGVGPP